MAADVLLYNVLNVQNATIISQNTTLDNNIACQNSLCETAIQSIATSARDIVANSGPNQANMWCLIPTISLAGGWASGFSVCDTSGSYRCGASCTWTVPAGCTCARFQIWGAGAGSGYACCCGFSPFGGTGAYASVIIPVTEGDTYTLCAGCAYCCYADAGGNNASGCPSYVTGTGLTNFCAEGGEGNLYCELLTRGVIGATTCAYCTYLGGCLCNSASDVCWQSNQGQAGSPACCWDNTFGFISSCKTFYGSATEGDVYGVRGSFGYISVNCNGTIYAIHPPIYGFATSSCCACIFTTNNTGGCCASAPVGPLRIPGAGGYANFKCAGNTTPAGDAGKFGMVCVSFR